MNTSTPTIPAETANHVLFHFGHGGYQAGSFTQFLIQAIDHADVINQDKLALGFPDYVAAVVAVQYDPNGVANLQRIAQQITCADCGGADGPFGERVEGYVCEGCLRKRAN